ncbi:MAG: cytochrome c peroxidase [Myxococcota bacterium]|nr:cytochrome c peroxidase [Myxococcota bacterium]
MRPSPVSSSALAWILGVSLLAMPAAGVDREALRERAAQTFGVLPAEVPNPANPANDARIDLGRLLYYETRLSLAQDLSCNSCHMLDRFGADGEPTSPGHEGQRGDRNSPTVYNAALHVTQFWDGRAADVEEQAKGPILNPVEMAMPSEEEVVKRLSAVPAYVELFGKAFPGEEEPLSYDNLAKAIGAFERRLTTPGKLDAFIGGELDALSDAEAAGLAGFMDTGCTTCHAGAALGGQLYQKIGLVHPYETEDTGREKVTGNAADRYFFKVPSLRNTAETGPWFHDGSITDLAEAVRLMGWHQLGQKLDDQQVGEIVSFLEALTGEVDATYVAKPKLP